jgi:hypothetical protein
MSMNTTQKPIDGRTTAETTGRDLGRTMSDATDAVGRTITDAAGNVRDLAASTADRVPVAAAAAKDLVVEADRQMRGGSDEVLATGATFSTGVALGLLVAGANRALVALAVVPAIAMALTLLERSADRSSARRARARS